MPSNFDIFDEHVVMTELDGKAIVVGEKILTACHCISLRFWKDSSSGSNYEPSLGTNPPVKLTTMTGRSFYANIEFADPVSDLAILGCPDRASFPAEAKAYEDCAPQSQIEVYLDEFIPDSQAHVRNRDGDWVEGAIYRVFPNRVSLDAVDRIYPGASGGPIVLDGKLLAVVSNACEKRQDGVFNGVHPLLSDALPRWWCR